jgi:hypothetical protein
MRFDWAIFLVAILAVPARAQLSGVAAVKPHVAADAKALSRGGVVALSESSDLVGGTLIGYAARADFPAVYPLHGFPGAAFPGPALALADAAGRPVVSSVGGYALAAGERVGELLVYGLRPSPASGRLLPSRFPVSTQPDQIILSPLGRVVLLYDRGRREVEVLAGLPGRPVSLYKVSLAGVQGVLTALAVSDDGSVGLAAFSSARGSGEIYALRRDTAASLVGAVSRVVHLSFVPESRDGLAADYERGQVLLLRDGGRQGVETVAGRNDGVVSPTAVEASAAGAVFVVNAGSETVVMVPAGQSAAAGLIRCGCAASGLERLKNPDSFRLTTGAGVIAVLEAQRKQPAVFYIPAGEEAEQELSSSRTPGRGRSR